MEHLHEFRIALRQTRSLIKLFLGDSIPFPVALKAAIKATNPIRELDVLMNSIPSSEYPKLSKQLSNIRKDTVQSLLTPKFVEHISMLLDEYSNQISKLNPYFIPEILVQQVLTHYQHCITTHKALKEDAKTKALHRLRIAFKDARYGFEFLECSEIHPSDKLIRHCKQLQNSLGAVQDAVNQVEWLEKLSKSHPSSAINELLKKQIKALKKIKDTTLSERSPEH